jgi:hypothetical protein
MDISQLPQPITLCGSGYTNELIAGIIICAIEDWPKRTFHHWPPVMGADRSIRLFSYDPHPDSVPLPRSITARQVAEELLRLTK